MDEEESVEVKRARAIAMFGEDDSDLDDIVTSTTQQLVDRHNSPRKEMNADDDEGDGKKFVEIAHVEADSDTGSDDSSDDELVTKKRIVSLPTPQIDSSAMKEPSKATTASLNRSGAAPELSKGRVRSRVRANRLTSRTGRIALLASRNNATAPPPPPTPPSSSHVMPPAPSSGGQATAAIATATSSEDAKPSTSSARDRKSVV